VFELLHKQVVYFLQTSYMKTMMTAPKHNLIGLNISELQEVLTPLNMPRYRVQQLYHWIYYHGVRNFEDMANLPKNLREALSEGFSLERPVIKIPQVSLDGTQKWLLSLADGNEVETVHIPEKTRGTLCVSSQVGCTLSCKFCHTGTQTLVRNLTVAEIVGQFMVARDVFGEWPAPEGNRHVSNIVMMGMGEPLYNYENVKKALMLIMDPQGLDLAPRRITLSTSGVVPHIIQCGEELGVSLAISLHAVTNELRNELVPINRKYPIEELLAACKNYPGTNKSNRITFEYVMLKGVNDSPAEARKLVQLLKNIPSKINLIPFNPWPKAPFECSSQDSINTFSAILEKAGYASPVRRPRGQDIFAACGQLKSLSQRLRKSKMKEVS
jgi:23S rRNA (adenine2503-C2)-methyltransferase